MSSELAELFATIREWGNAPGNLTLTQLTETVLRLPMPACIVGADQRFVAANDALRNTVGSPNGEIAGRHYRDLLPPEAWDAPTTSRPPGSLSDLQHVHFRWHTESNAPIVGTVLYRGLLTADGHSVYLSALVDDEEGMEVAQRLGRPSHIDALLQQSLDAIFLADPSGVIIEWSPGAEAVFGIRRGEALGATIFDIDNRLHARLVHTVSDQCTCSPVPRDVLRHVAEDGVTRITNFSITRGDGTIRTLQAHFFPVRWQDRSLAAGIVRDVSEHVQQALVRQVMNQIGQAALSAKNVHDLACAIHEIIQQLMPAPNFYLALADEARGCVDFPYFVDEAKPCGPHSRRYSHGMTEYILRTGEQVLLSREDVLDMHNAGHITVSQGYPESYIAVPLSGERGKPIGVVALQSYSTDVIYTERELSLLQFISSQIALVVMRSQAEERVRAQRDFAQVLLDTATVFVLVLNLDGTIRTFNAYTEQAIGTSAEEAMGTDWFCRFVHPEDTDGARASFAANLTGPTRAPYTNRIITPAGEVRLVEWRGSTVTLAGGDTVMLVTGYDITEMHQLGQQLLLSQKMEAVGRLAGGVAHDINNILTVIKGHTHLVLDRSQPEDPNRDDLEQICKSSDRATLLTRQLLAFARRQVMQTRAVDARTLIERSDQLIQPLLRPNIRLHVVYASHPHLVQIDLEQIERVLINLVVNAREAMPSGGNLTLSLDMVEVGPTADPELGALSPGEYVRLSVKDTGVGMSDDLRSHIFEPFFSTKDTGRNTGLGLSTAYGVVRQHAGAIRALSELGTGTTMEVYLPHYRGDVHGAGSSIPALPRGNEHILVITREAEIRVFMARLLREQGYAVHELRTADDAVEAALREDPFDLLITDYLTPGLTGPALTAALRDTIPGLRVLYLCNEPLIRSSEQPDPRVDFLVKPFSSLALANAVRELLDRR